MPRRTNQPGITGTETMIGTDVKLKGNLASEGDIIVDGTLHGDVSTTSDFTVGHNGIITAQTIKARNVNIYGHVQGDITAEEQVVLYETAQLVGNINASTLAVATGATLNGQVKIVAVEHSTANSNSKETNQPDSN